MRELSLCHSIGRIMAKHAVDRRVLLRANLAQVGPGARVLLVSSKTGEGVDARVDWVLGL